MDEVLKRALVRQPTPIEWDEVVDKMPARTDEDASNLVAH